MPPPVLKDSKRILLARVVKHMTAEAELVVRLHFRHPLNGSQQSSSVPWILLLLWFIGYFLLTCSPLKLFAEATSMQRERALSIELPLPPRSSRLNLQDSKLEFS
ncbi:uncharacterized protein APUU_50513A [Aspergillus puulaauensis]|uniref:Uncharacterized protein n=1 Tax=Aspergillus puulaauensis TaxID=1220207 RepID=A0A7R7XR16_9EURO|nr:uncharacterized protein APUU_50513A [Aspergillus puulaauensis]BCS25802.1 hypothetical protein APUU_50513A [Aspergillus puulaauensis]